MAHGQRVLRIAVVVASAAVSGCSAGGAGIDPHVRAPAARPAAVTITIDVPAVAGPADIAVRRPRYISTASKSVTFTIDQPDVDQTDLQQRTVSYDLVPGPNAIPLDLVEGDLTIQGTIYDAAGGKGHELSVSDPKTASLEAGKSETIELIFNPVIVQAATSVVPGTLKLTVLSDTKNQGGDETICYGLAGQYTIGGLDAAGAFVYGAGRYLDVHHNPVTVSPTPAGAIRGSQTGANIPSGGVSVSGGSAAMPGGGGSFSETVVASDVIGAAVGATASSSLVKPANTLAGPIALVYFTTFETPSCIYVSGG